MKNSIQLEVRNKSLKIICPNCKKYITVLLDGKINVSELSTRVNDGRRFDSINDLDLNFSTEFGIKCKSCSEKCIVEDYAFSRLLSAFDKFDHCGFSSYKLCEISKTPKIIDGNMSMVFTMPKVSYILPLKLKNYFENILSYLMTTPQMRENGSYIVLCRNTITDHTKYYKLEFYIDKDMINLIYDPDKYGKDYKNYVDRIFINKINQLAELIETVSTMPDEEEDQTLNS